MVLGQVIRGRGGAVLVKKHTTKKDRLNALKQRSIDIINKDGGLNFDAPGAVANQSLEGFLKSFRDKLAAADGLDSTQIFAELFKKLDDDKLQQLEEVADTKNRMKTEDKMLRYSTIMVGEILELEAADTHINIIKTQFIAHFVKVFGEEFNSERSGVANYDNSKFYIEVKNTQRYRQGLRQGTRTEQAEADGSAQEGEQRCTIS